MLNEPTGKISGYEGSSFDRIVQCAHNLEDAERFVKGGTRKIPMPDSDEMLAYDPFKRSGIGTKLRRADSAETINSFVMCVKNDFKLDGW